MNFWDFNVLFIFLIHWHLINTYKLSNYREQHLNFFSLLNATRFQTRVIGGVDCQYGERPFQCGLVDERVFPYGHFGGCVIIGHRVVLTAAHCAELADPLWTKVVYNRITQLVSAIEANNACDVIEVETIIIHPKYNRYTLDYDIAILVLKDRMRFNRFQASAIELIEPNIILPPGTIVELSGWGVIETRPHLKTPIILQKVKLPIVATNKCREIYNNSENSLYTITDRMICAGGLPDGGKDSCVGDSGGPLTYECDGRTILAGITSKGADECGDPNIPGVYTRVSSFTKWTKRHLRKYEEEDIHYVVN